MNRIAFLTSVCLLAASVSIGCASKYIESLEKIVAESHGTVYGTENESTRICKGKIQQTCAVNSSSQFTENGYHYLLYTSSPKNPTGILLHATGGEATDNEKFAIEFCKYGFNLASLDLPGHGETKERAFTAEEVFRGIDETRKQLDVNFLIGTSMGGDFAIYYALEHPEIKSIFAHAPMLNSIKPMDFRFALARNDLGRLIIGIWNLGSKEIKLSRLYNNRDLVANPELVSIFEDKNNPKEYNFDDYFQGVLAYNQEISQNYRTPTLIAQAMHDPLIKTEHVLEIYEALKSKNPNIELWSTGNLTRSHLILTEYPQETAEIAAQWFNKTLNK